MNKELLNRYESLKDQIKKQKNAAVAFSGGVDSAILLYAAHEALGEDVFALTAVSEFYPQRETEEAAQLCERFGVRQIFLNIQALDIPGVAANPRNRCYLCKKELFAKMKEIAFQHGAEVLMDGTNKDDEGDYRPGLAALQELNVMSPLRDLGFTKSMVRELSHHLLLPTWNKQSFACLASRFPYGETITAGKLAMVDRAEQCLLNLGFGQMRVRAHGDLARIEVERNEMARFSDDKIREQAVDGLKKAGFTYVSLDLTRYRTGSMNEATKITGSE